MKRMVFSHKRDGNSRHLVDGEVSESKLPAGIQQERTVAAGNIPGSKVIRATKIALLSTCPF